MKKTLTIALALSFIQFSASAKWKKVKSKAGITVLKREVKGSSIVEFRGKGMVYSNLVKVLAIIADRKNVPKWVDRVITVKELKKYSKTSSLFYTAVKAPWPLQDRDFVGKSSFMVDNKYGWIHLSLRSRKSSYKIKGRHRMPFTHVTWSFKPYGEKKTWVEFKTKADPGGAIPNWVANMVAKDLPYKSLINLRKRAGKKNVSKAFYDSYKNEYYNWGWNKKWMKEHYPKKKKKKKKKKGKKKKKK